jgi:hypothetical protein
MHDVVMDRDPNQDQHCKHRREHAKLGDAPELGPPLIDQAIVVGRQGVLQGELVLEHGKRVAAGRKCGLRLS